MKPGDLLWYDNDKHPRAEEQFSPASHRCTSVVTVPTQGWLTVIHVGPDPDEPNKEIVTFLYHGHLCCEYTWHIKEHVNDETR